MYEHLKYVDEQDKSYGIAGMVISLVVSEADDLIRGVSLDDEFGDAISFSPEFHFSGNPRFSARTVFNETVKHFQLAMGMMVSNVLCRSYVHRGSRSLSSEMSNELRTIVKDEGYKSCSLDDDEIELLFNKSFSYFERLFSHSSVHEVVSEFVSELNERRHLSSGEVIDILGRLSMS